MPRAIGSKGHGPWKSIEGNLLARVVFQNAVEALGFELGRATSTDYRLSGGDLPGNGVIVWSVDEVVEELEDLGVEAVGLWCV